MDGPSPDDPLVDAPRNPQMLPFAARLLERKDARLILERPHDGPHGEAGQLGHFGDGVGFRGCLIRLSSVFLSTENV